MADDKAAAPHLRDQRGRGREAEINSDPGRIGASSARTSGATIAGNVLPTEAKVCCPNIAASATSIGDSVFRLAASISRFLQTHAHP